MSRCTLTGIVIGFLWGIPVPVFMLYIDATAQDVSLDWQSIFGLIQTRSLHIFFLLHPILFSVVFGLSGHILDQFLKRNEDLLSHYEQKSVTDSLTSLKNHSMFFELLHEEMSRSQRRAELHPEKERLSLILLDIDHFKQINDRFGHLYGDRILKQFSQILKSSIRNYDHACRYGGDEFAIIMPETNQQQAAAICERIREQVQTKMVCGEQAVTISAGVAEFDEKDTSRNQMFQFVKKVDHILYTAKAKGRNRIEILST